VLGLCQLVFSSLGGRFDAAILQKGIETTSFLVLDEVLDGV
jgi:hypothetical protein